MTPLHFIGDFIRELMASVPMPIVRGIFIAVPVLLMIWVLLLPSRETRPVGGTGRWDENLKLWACVALCIQIVVYIVF